MKLGLYPKLAFSGIRKNSRLYLPYILTCIGMVMMYYIVKFLACSEKIRKMNGGGAIVSTLGMGSVVIAVFALIFLFYTNSFLIRRRNREFGLCSILGMGKLNIGRILFWETLITAEISLAAGLFLGIMFSKLAELALVNIMHSKATLDFSVDGRSVYYTALTFTVIFLIILIRNLVRVQSANPKELMASESSGEKPPKANWGLGLLGLIILAAAYYIAVTIKDPLSAMMMFFIAVIVVILATYILFISGYVVLCRALQKNKGYYYKPDHFVSVSSMAYRMKRNGAGLASICILATMVLVTVSSTTCLYFGAEDSLKNRYPREISVTVKGEEALGEGKIAAMREMIIQTAKEAGAEPRGVYDSGAEAAAGGQESDGSRWSCEFDTGLDEEGQISLYYGLEKAMAANSAPGGCCSDIDYYSIEGRAVNRGDFYGTYGGLFFLGLMLSAVFICAAVLIIYYKQISEGYEDQARFDIMQKVGMTKKNIRRSINSQLMTVFYMPFVFACIHLAFAFPMIEKILRLFNLNNVWLFAFATVISVAVFALLYTLVYRATSNAYYAIVSGAREESA